jgi:hypothetical protein
MSWARASVATAIAADLFAATEGGVTAFADPPPTFNIPAFIVGWPQTVIYDIPIMGVDEVTLPVITVAGLPEAAAVDQMLNTARAALEADRTLGGLLAHGVLVVTGTRNWRALLDVGGGQYLAADLMLTIRM